MSFDEVRWTFAGTFRRARVFSGVIFLGLLIACAPNPTAVSGSTAAASPTAFRIGVPTNLPGCGNCVTISDAVLGVRLPAPRDYFYIPAQPATGDPVLTDTARLSSYSLASTRPADMAKELLVEMFLAPRRGDDLRAIAEKRFSVPVQNARDVTIGNHPALRAEGDFQNGRRTYVLIQVDAERVLVISAFPAGSTRAPDFERMLQYLNVG